MKTKNTNNNMEFVSWFRQSSPYIHAFRGRTFILVFGGESVADDNFANLVHDIALLSALGIRLILVHGSRPQVELCLKNNGAKINIVNQLRITDDQALICVKEAAGRLRVEIEALLSMGVANSPMEGARIRVASGNFVTAQPIGIHDGIDYCHTGKIRRIDSEAIKQRLDDNAIVLLSPLGYSPTGEIFNLSANEVATATAIALKADKLLFMTDSGGIHDADNNLIRELGIDTTQQLLTHQQSNDDELHFLSHALQACQQGVKRTHLIDRHVDGGLLQELFSRDGIGTLITGERFEETRQASIEDVGGILELIEPLEAEGILVRRSREQLELEINNFTVVERDGTIIACAALYAYPNQQLAELACLAVHTDYRNANRGNSILTSLEKAATQAGIKKLFVLSTNSSHWFLERGFKVNKLEQLPLERQQLYNYQRNSKVFIKTL